ncbi:probable 2' cyclic ADP-D-ribose synthase BdTIR [Cornus florida]|uniref:probable 2' cyclic ADP-D-ribose synthase BdTIR n=1 Tax=Cornus florida TaxID=4283 RepID=UPI00289B8903|nr:probable 2' cyclic ADP-D-ribose synthase BdTIR [Cornus florida]
MYACHKILKSQPCDVFINHRGVDTKRSVAGLLYNHFARLNLRPFLDNKVMKPGDKLLQMIDMAIRDCKVGIAVFSPRYCESYFCLHELSLLMESKKRVVPIFCDVKPSELRVRDSKICSAKELHRFRWALEEARDWADLLRSASEAVLKNLIEVEEERDLPKKKRLKKKRD